MSGEDQASFDEAEWDAAVALVARADELVAGGDPAAGRDLAVAAKELLARVVGVDHPDYAQALVSEADALSALGHPAEAKACLGAALAVLDRYAGGEDAALVRPFRVPALMRLGYHLSLDGRYGEAEALLREALAEATTVHGEDAPELAEHLNTLGVCLRFSGRYPEAAAAYQRAAELRTRAGLEQPAGHLHNLAGLACALEDFAAAEHHARAAVAARRASEGEGFALATDLCGLGDALAGLGRPGEAEAAYREALALFLASARADHPEVAFALHNLADTLVALDRPGEAEATYREAIERKTRALGPTHYELASTLNNLAALLADLGRGDEARALAARAVTIVQALLEPEHPVRRGCEALARALGA